MWPAWCQHFLEVVTSSRSHSREATSAPLLAPSASAELGVGLGRVLVSVLHTERGAGCELGLGRGPEHPHGLAACAPCRGKRPPRSVDYAGASTAHTFLQQRVLFGHEPSPLPRGREARESSHCLGAGHPPLLVPSCALLSAASWEKATGGKNGGATQGRRRGDAGAPFWSKGHTRRPRRTETGKRTCAAAEHGDVAGEPAHHSQRSRRQHRGPQSVPQTPALRPCAGAAVTQLRGLHEGGPGLRALEAGSPRSERRRGGCPHPQRAARASRVLAICGVVQQRHPPPLPPSCGVHPACLSASTFPPRL